jgi:hypothetical protein
MTVEVKVLAWYVYKIVRQLDMTVEVQVLVWYRYKHVAGLNRLMGSQLSPHVKPVNGIPTLPSC